jgi:uncharacterized membrane protein YoaK (UPF0700 family)
MAPAGDREGTTAHLDGPDFGLALLAIGAGSMDALGFLSLGGALPSATTGNTALLGLALGQGHLGAAARPFAASLGYVLGAGLAATLLNLKLVHLPVRHGTAWLIGVEAVLLIGFVLAWQFVDRRVADLPLHLLLVLGAGAMGVQSVAARQDNRPGVNTVVFTIMLTTFMIAATRAALGTSHRLGFDVKRQVFMFLAYGLGAVIGGFLTLRGIEVLPFLPLLASLAALAFHMGSPVDGGTRPPVL